MKVTGNNTQRRTIGQKIARPFKAAGSAVKKGVKATGSAVKKSVKAVDDYTSPREGTAGDFKKASYFQSGFTGALEGFYVLGPAGIVTGAASGLAGSAVSNATGKVSMGVVTGIVTGAALGAGTAALVGGPAGLVGGAIAGGVLGAMETFRGDSKSQTRDGAGTANMISAAFVPGPAKMAGGIGSAIGTRFKSKIAKAMMGGISAAAIGGVLAAVGFAPVSIPIAVAGCAAAGVAGPFVGPRFSQLFRNLANDIGNGIEKGLKKVGLVKEDKGMGKAKNVVGAIPASIIKEGIRGFALSGGDIGKMVIGSVTESVKQTHMFLNQDSDNKEADKAEAKKESFPKTIKVEDPSLEKNDV